MCLYWFSGFARESAGDGKDESGVGKEKGGLGPRAASRKGKLTN